MNKLDTTTTLDSDNFQAVVENRRSIRGFLDRQIAQSDLEKIFTLAQRAPSNCNTQPWSVAVVSGDRCRTLATKITKAMMIGDIQMDFPYEGVYEGVYKNRQHQAAADLYGAMGIGREDKTERGEAFMRNFDFFDAPHVAFFFLPKNFGVREAADLGMYTQTFMLALTAHGMGSCPQTALSFQPHIIRKELGISDDQKLLFGMSFGYPDLDCAANNCTTGREDCHDVVSFF